jgi:hypothetical protein
LPELSRGKGKYTVGAEDTRSLVVEVAGGAARTSEDTVRYIHLSDTSSGSGTNSVLYTYTREKEVSAVMAQVRSYGSSTRSGAAK